MHIRIINGPNLDLLGKREPEIYGSRSFGSFLEELRGAYAGTEIGFFQSNVEGELINALREADASCQGVVLNAAGYSHTSVALRDAVAAMRIPVVEVHISNVHAREDFRQHLLTGAVCAGCITGFGLDGYRMAVDHLLRREA